MDPYKVRSRRRRRRRLHRRRHGFIFFSGRFRNGIFFHGVVESDFFPFKGRFRFEEFGHDVSVPIFLPHSGPDFGIEFGLPGLDEIVEHLSAAAVDGGAQLHLPGQFLGVLDVQLQGFGDPDAGFVGPGRSIMTEEFALFGGDVRRVVFHVVDVLLGSFPHEKPGHFTNRPTEDNFTLSLHLNTRASCRNFPHPDSIPATSRNPHFFEVFHVPIGHP